MPCSSATTFLRRLFPTPSTRSERFKRTAQALSTMTARKRAVWFKRSSTEEKSGPSNREP